MSKTKAKVERIHITYSLHDLPTAQHKAGLAGLVLQIESMRARDLPSESIPELISVTPTTVGVAFTEASTRGLFDDLYDATVEQITPGSGLANERDVDESPEKHSRRDWAETTRKPFDVVAPAGHFLAGFMEGGKESWHRLWREMLFKIPRAQDRSRDPYRDMAKLWLSRQDRSEWSRFATIERKNDKKSYLCCREGLATWGALTHFQESRTLGELETTKVSGALRLGAQDRNAESLPFFDRIDHALLLHFWPLTVSTYVPRTVDDKGDHKNVGYVLAVPEVTDLGDFTDSYREMLGRLEAAEQRHRPPSAIVTLPEQGALAFLSAISKLMEQKAADSELRYTVSGIEFFHVVKNKKGNTVKTVAHGRVAPHRTLLVEYQGIRKSCRNPLFLSARLLALLRGKYWYEEFPSLLAQRKWEFFVHSRQKNHETPKAMRSFARDVRNKFWVAKQNVSKRETNGMNETDEETSEKLQVVVHRLVQTYVNRKTEDKSGITYDSFRDKTETDEKGRKRVVYPRAYVEAREKICSDAFLGFRSRRDEDFVDYFISTIGSVSQYLPEDDYRVVAAALMTQDGVCSRASVRTLAMLALSGASYTPGTAKEDD